jgi:outer membrane immunogenic protein
MRRLVFGLLATSALSTGFGPPASAADLTIRPVVHKAPPAVMALPYNWGGLYVGGHLGGGWAHKHWSSPGFGCVGGTGTIGCLSDLGSHQANGLLGGGQAGFNWQSGSWVFGIEGQFSFASLTGDHSLTNKITSADGLSTFTGTERFSTKVRDLGTIAGRIGMVLAPMGTTLLYAKGGAAFANDHFTLQPNGSCSGPCRTFPVTTSGSFDESQERWGWMIGFGIEHAFSENWSAKVEYNHLDLGTENVTLTGRLCAPACVPASRTVAVDQTIDLIKFGINYRFRSGPVYSKY